MHLYYISTAELPNRNMNQEDDYLASILSSHQHLMAKYQDLDSFIKQQVLLWQDRDDQWTQKLAQDSEWRTTIEEKLDIILNLLGHGQPPPLDQAPSNLGQHLGHSPPHFFQPSQNVQLGQPLQPPQNFQVGQGPPTYHHPQTYQPSTLGQYPPTYGQTTPLQTVVGDSLGSYFGQYLTTTQLWLLQITDDLQGHDGGRMSAIPPRRTS